MTKFQVSSQRLIEISLGRTIRLFYERNNIKTEYLFNKEKYLFLFPLYFIFVVCYIHTYTHIHIHIHITHITHIHTYNTYVFLN